MAHLKLKQALNAVGISVLPRMRNLKRKSLSSAMNEADHANLPP